MKAPMPILFRNARYFDGSGADAVTTDLLIDRHARTVGARPGPDLEVREVDLEGLYVSDGWVDLHVHVFEGNGLFSVDPARIGLSTGVTTLVDAGSAGPLNFDLFEKRIMRPARETIRAYANISSCGVMHGHAQRPGFLGDHFHPSLFSPDLALALADSHAEFLVGWKVRLSGILAGHERRVELAAFDFLLEMRERTGLPVMVHHVLSSISPEEVLTGLRAGDVYTHLYHGLESTIFDPASGVPLDAALEARERGVIFDVGHGVGAFRWSCAEQACGPNGFWPDVISSDLHAYNLFSPVRDLAETMSKFLRLGLDPGAVVSRVTQKASAAIRHKPPHDDLTIFDIEEGSFPFEDAEGGVRNGTRRFVPIAVIKSGQLSPCHGLFSSPRMRSRLPRALQEAAAF